MRLGQVVLLMAAICAGHSVRAEGQADPSRTYAILISGGSKQSSNHYQFLGNMQLTYGMLRQDMGVPKENITVLWGSGDPSQDLCLARKSGCAECKQAKMPLNPSDLDRDGVGDIDGAATVSNVTEAFRRVKSVLRDSDQLFVYVTDHGAKYNVDLYVDYVLAPFSRICLWNDETLTDWMLADLVRDVRGPVVMAFNCCYSGGVLADLLKSDGIRFAASATADTVAYPGDTKPWYDQWTYHFVSALRGCYPKSLSQPLTRGKACSADANGDGLVSFREAARFAYRKRYSLDSPQYAESWSGCGNRLFPVMRMTAEEVRDYSAAHAAERRGFLGFRKACSLKLKNGASSPDADLDIEFAGERLALSAPAVKADKKKGVLEFQQWTWTPASEGLGLEFDASAASTHFVMPPKALTLSPVYGEAKSACQMTMFAVPDDPRQASDGAFQWSPDGKTWYASGATATLPSGTYDIRWRSLSAAWTAPSGRKKVKLKAGGTFDNSAAPAVFTYVPAVLTRIEVLKDGEWVNFQGGGTVTFSPSSGRKKAGGTITVTAKPEKKYAFVGWQAEGVTLKNPQTAKQSFKMPNSDITLVARFITAEFDVASVRLSVDGREPSAGDGDTIRIQAVCGVSLDWPVVFSGYTATSAKFLGLPKGLSVKRDKKTGACSLVGVPTTASKLAKGATVRTPTKARVVVTTAAKNTRNYDLEVTVLPLPKWAVGSFSGFAAADAAGTGPGAAALTVQSGGKISGSFAVQGTKWTYSAAGYSRAASSPDSPDFAVCLAGTAKSGKKALPFEINVVSGACNCAVAELRAGAFVGTMRRSVWADKALPSPRLSKTNLASWGHEGLSVTVSAAGAAKFAGRLEDGTKVTSSSTVFVDEEIRRGAVLLVPASKKYGGFLEELDLSSVIPQGDSKAP